MIRWLRALAIVLPAVVCNHFSTAADAPVTTPKTVRFATYNVSLYGKRSGEIAQRLSLGNDRQARDLATVIQSVRPDVLLVNEIDFDSDGKTIDLFADRYLGVDGNDTNAIAYPHRYSIPSNTGIDSGIDLNVDGEIRGPNDSWGYGLYPGQYAMAILSRFPIDRDSIRTFQNFLWSELPSALRPMDPRTKSSFYTDDVWSSLRLSSKNHVDVPIMIGERRVHLLVSHPTPPVFDGPEDRNGCRNHDEIKFWVHYLDADSDSFLVDDRGKLGGLRSEELFVVAGDLNADAVRGDGRREAITSLLQHSRLNDAVPLHVLPEGSATEPPTTRLSTTAAFGGKDGMRVDYVLPSRQMPVVASGVFWPSATDPRKRSISASDHRLVWVEVSLP